MAHIASTFSSAFAGVLEVTFKGDFLQGVRRDAGFPTGSSNMLLRGFVGPTGSPGSRKYTPAIDRYVPSTFMRCDYPGSNAVWDVGTELVAFETSGISIFGFENIEVYLCLIKR